VLTKGNPFFKHSNLSSWEVLAMSKPRFYLDRSPSTLPSFQKKTNIRFFPLFFSLDHYWSGSSFFDPKSYGTNPFNSFRSWKPLEYVCSFLYDPKCFGTNSFVSLRSLKAIGYLCLFRFNPIIWNESVCFSSFLKSSTEKTK